MHPTTESYVAFRNVSVRYTDQVTGLHPLNLTISKGEFVFLVGKTGAGKSTLLKLLTREVKETSGNVLIDGQDLGQISDGKVPFLRRGMGIIPQDFALLPRKRVWENVAYAMRAIGSTKREVRERVPRILEKVNIGHRADAFPNQLSGGEQQRVAIARALIKDPPLILADEPTGNLDHEHSWEIMEILLQLNRQGATIIVASHDQVVVERMGKRIITLDQGKIVSDTPARPEAIPTHAVIETQESTVEEGLTNA